MRRLETITAAGIGWVWHDHESVLKDTVALVTGASSGIGRAAALALAAELGRR